MIIRFIARYRLYIVLLLVDVLFFGLFTPNQTSWLLIPGFGLLVATIYVAIKGVLAVLGEFVRLSPLLKKKITVFLTFVLAVVLALQSLGQLTPRDIITVVPLIAVLYLYVSYFTLKR